MEAKNTAGPPSVLRRSVALDTKISGEIHIIAKPFLPHFLLLLLEISADLRLFFPVGLSLLLVQGGSNSSFLWPLILGLLFDLAHIGLIKIHRPPRARPVNNSNMTVAVSVDHFSFPSGHASRVRFAASLAFLSAADQFSVLVSAVCAWAAATSISRILL